MYDPRHPSEPLLLRGFNLMFMQGQHGMSAVAPEDASLPQLAPHTSLLRLVLVHWLDDVTTAREAKTSQAIDCYTDRVEIDYLRPECLQHVERVLHWATGGNGSFWVTVTVRSALAAGDGGSHVFGNLTLRHQWETMLGSLARRCRHLPWIAGYEVMSASPGLMHRPPRSTPPCRPPAPQSGGTIHERAA